MKPEYRKDANQKVEATSPNEFQKFDAVVKKILTVPRTELKKREKAWQQKRAKKKRAIS
jgi:hypothetical protein